MDRQEFQQERRPSVPEASSPTECDHVPGGLRGDCLAILSSRVRLLTDRQISEWFLHTKNPRLMAKQWIQRQRRTGLLDRRVFLSHPELSLEVPVHVFTPGDADPNFDRLAWRLTSRWRAPATRTTVVWATALARERFGSTLRHRPIRLAEVTHDIHVSRLFLNLRQRDPQRAALWVAEDALPWGTPTIRPDAVVEDTWIEFGGAYSARKIRQMHEAYRRHTYELW